MIDIESHLAVAIPQWVLTVNGHPVVASICKHVCERYARKLDEARNSSYRVAMRIMTEELGMCEDFARGVYSELFGEAHSTVN